MTDDLRNAWRRFLDDSARIFESNNDIASVMLEYSDGYKFQYNMLDRKYKAEE